MQIQFIFHSSYLVEFSRFYLLFDYYQGELPELDPNKELYIFASHVHYDHFSPVVFQLIRKYPNMKFILSDDISEETCREALEELGHVEQAIYWIRPGIEYDFPDLRVHALPSTDQGVSYLVRAEDSMIFHAGDLNDWCWPNVPLSRNQQMRQDYLEALEELKGEMQEMGKKLTGGAVLDAAFLPMDPVLGDGQFRGPLDFLERIDVRYVFPMHMWERYSIGQQFLEQHPEYRKNFRPIRGAGQRFSLDKDRLTGL